MPPAASQVRREEACMHGVRARRQAMHLYHAPLLGGPALLQVPVWRVHEERSQSRAAAGRLVLRYVTSDSSHDLARRSTEYFLLFYYYIHIYYFSLSSDPGMPRRASPAGPHGRAEVICFRFFSRAASLLPQKLSYTHVL